MMPVPRQGLLVSLFLLMVLLQAMPAAHAQFNPEDYSYPVVTQSDFYIFNLETVVDGLLHPWALEFLPNGDMLITERPGRLRIVRDGRLDPVPVAGVPEVWYRGQAGLFDVAVHPDFESNRLLYLSFIKPSTDGSQGAIAVARGRFDGRRLTDVEDIFVAEPWVDSPGHFGSRLVFDADGYLFISTGDMSTVSPVGVPQGQHPSQDLSNHQGTIVRLHDDGRVPDDNPFVNHPGAKPEIWSYGHRNIQGMAIDPGNGNLWASEHGPMNGDELNLIRKGRNYGWPVIGFGILTGGTVIHENTMHEGMEQPIAFWAPSIAPSGVMVYTGDKFPEWRGNIFVAGMRGHELHRLDIVQFPDGSHHLAAAEEPPLLQGIGRVRDVVQGPAGYVYIVLDDRPERGRTTPVLRLEPVQAVEENPHYHPLYIE